MKLNILTWNVNFIHDNWLQRLDKINKTLEKKIKKFDLIALQEATLPFSDKLTDFYKFLKTNKNIKYFGDSLIFHEKNFLYNSIKKHFPRYKKHIITILEFFMDQLLFICSWIFSRYGEKLKQLYRDHTYLCFFIGLLCPIIFVGVWFFIGMVTIISNKINGIVSCKYFGRPFQYCKFNYNNRDCVFVNVHLTPFNKENKRIKEIEELLKFIKNTDVCILAGDFNSTQYDEVYKILKNNGYRSVVFNKKGKEVPTFPSWCPIKTLDYIWIKGKNIKIKKVKHFGNKDATDHKGIAATIDIGENKNLN